MISIQQTRGKRASLKKGIDFDGGRRRRNDERAKLRKNRRLEGLQRKRAIQSSAPRHNQDETDMMKTDDFEVKLPQFLVDMNLTISDSVVQLLMKSNVADNTTSTLPVNPMTIDGRNGAHTRDLVIQSGIVPLLVKNLLSEKLDIREQSAICIGNISGESHELRDHVIQCGVIDPLLHNISNSPNDEFLEKIVWSLSNLCRGKQTAEMNNIIPVFPVLIKLLGSSHSETLINTCWALAYLTEDNDTVAQELIEQDLTTTFVPFLAQENTKIAYVVMRILGNFILSGHIQKVIDAGIMNHTDALLSSHDRSVRYEICYVLSLIVDSGDELINLIIDSSSELEIIINILKESSLDERMEAGWVIFNIATKGTDIQLKALVDMDVMSALCFNLNVPDIKFLLLVLDSIENILIVGERLALDYRCSFEDNGGKEKIESLLSHPNDKVYSKANEIYEEFLEQNTDDDWDQERWYY